MHPLRRAGLILAFLLVGMAGLSSSTTEPFASALHPPSIRAAGTADQQVVVIWQRNKFYDPPVVVIHEGDVVLWANGTKGGWHDVQSYEDLFSSGRMDPGISFAHAFEQPGVYGYFCSIHAFDGMIGAVVVLPKGAPLPDPIPLPAPLPLASAPASSPVAAGLTSPEAPDTISTIAGGGGNGGLATDASLYLPEAVALDDEGRLFIVDTENCQVRRADPTGIVVSIVGHESCGFTMGADADLGPWLHSNHPRGIAVGPDGAPYVADTGNCRIRRGGEGATVSTIAGTGSCRASGDGGPALEAGLSPWGVAWDLQGNLYVADVFNCRIRKIDEAGIINTVAGDGTCGFSGDGGPATLASLFFPRDVAVAPDGALYVADTANCRVRRIEPTTGIIETVAGNGSCSYSGDGASAAQAGLHPWALALASDGSVLVADRENCRLRRFVTGGTITTVAGTGVCGFSSDGGPAADAALNWPSDVAVAPDGALYLADTGNCRIRRIDGDGVITTVIGSGVCASGGDGGPATAGGVWHAIDLITGTQGEWYFSELDTCRIRRVDATGIVTTYAGTGICGFSGDGGAATEARLSDMLGGLAIADDGSLYIAEGYNCRVRRVDPDGFIDTVAGNGTCGFSGDGGPAREASLNFVSDVALDGSGGLYLAGPFNCRVRQVDLATGTIDTVVGDGSCLYNGEDIPAEEAGVEPWGVAVGPDGALYMGDSGNCRVRRVGADGRITTVAGGDACGFEGDGGPATQAQLLRPYDVVLDQDGNLYVADLRTFTVRKVDGQGIITTVAGVGISRPIDIGGFDPTGGFSCSLHSLSIPVPSYLGDGGPATQGGLYFPYGIALGHDGDLYIADTYDHRVRRVTCGAGVPCSGPAAFVESIDNEAPPTAGQTPDNELRLPSTGHSTNSEGTIPMFGILGGIGGALMLGAAIWLFAGRRHRKGRIEG